jgi:hypothetical protein
MEAPNTPTSTTALPTRLRRFKDACVEKSCLEAQIEKMIERREILAIRKVERAEKELERIMTNAATVRFELESIRLPTCRGTAMKGEITKPEPPEFNSGVTSENAKPEVISSPPGEGMAVKDPHSHSSCLGPPSSSTSSSDSSSIVLDGPSSTSVSPNIRNEAIPTVPLSKDEEEHCDEILSSQAQHYIRLCEERRSLEKGIEQELDTEERFAIEQVQSAKSSLEAVRKRISNFVANLRKTSGEETVIAVPPTVDCWLLPHGGSYCWPSHLPPLFHCYATSSRLGSSAQSSHISYCLYYIWLLIVTLCILGAQRVIGEDPHSSSPISLVVLGPIPTIPTISMGDEDKEEVPICVAAVTIAQSAESPVTHYSSPHADASTTLFSYKTQGMHNMPTSPNETPKSYEVAFRNYNDTMQSFLSQKPSTFPWPMLPSPDGTGSSGSQSLHIGWTTTSFSISCQEVLAFVAAYCTWKGDKEGGEREFMQSQWLRLADSVNSRLVGVGFINFFKIIELKQVAYTIGDILS